MHLEGHSFRRLIMLNPLNNVCGLPGFFTKMLIGLPSGTVLVLTVSAIVGYQPTVASRPID